MFFKSKKNHSLAKNFPQGSIIGKALSTSFNSPTKCRISKYPTTWSIDTTKLEKIRSVRYLRWTYDLEFFASILIKGIPIGEKTRVALM